MIKFEELPLNDKFDEDFFFIGEITVEDNKTNKKDNKENKEE